MKRVNPYRYSPDCAEMHLLVEMLYRAAKFFKGKLYDLDTINVHIPLPLRGVLLQSIGGLDTKSAPFEGGEVTIFGMRCVPGYENKVVISHPEYAIFDNEPMVVIELETENNYPTYFEIN